MNILGLNIYGHDTAAAVICDGEMIAAIEEERLTRAKHDRSFPVNAVEKCLEMAGLTIEDIDVIALSKNFEKLFREKYLRYTLDNFPKSNSLFLEGIDNMKEIITAEDEVRKRLNYSGKIVALEHHMCHFASSYYSSGYKESALISVDGLGEIASTVIGHGVGNDMKIIKEINYPHSLGMLYSAVTYYLGYTPNSSEGTTMALASFGDSEAEYKGKTYYDYFCDMVYLKDDGEYEINLEYFNFPFTRKGWVSDKFTDIFGTRDEILKDKISVHTKNIAAALQRRFEDVYLHVIRYAHKVTGSKNLSVAGGCALNCVANGKVLKETEFTDIYIQPAASDSGTAIGAALLMCHMEGERTETVRRDQTYWGPEYDNAYVEELLKREGLSYTKLENPSVTGAKLLSEGSIIGWYQGRMEFGPRALGNRSILSAPFPVAVKDRINADIKHREMFRPFAPSVLEDHTNDYFHATCSSPFMLMAFDLREEKVEDIAAVAHVDNTGRIQSVSKELNEKYYTLINTFYELTGVPVVLNTSFNGKGEPIVCKPEEAVAMYKRSKLDALIVNDFLIQG